MFSLEGKHVACMRARRPCICGLMHRGRGRENREEEERARQHGNTYTHACPMSHLEESCEQNKATTTAEQAQMLSTCGCLAKYKISCTDSTCRFSSLGRKTWHACHGQRMWVYAAHTSCTLYSSCMHKDDDDRHRHAGQCSQAVKGAASFACRGECRL